MYMVQIVSPPHYYLKAVSLPLRAASWSRAYKQNRHSKDRGGKEGLPVSGSSSRANQWSHYLKDLP